jgi:hypothetical protein
MGAKDKTRITAAEMKFMRIKGKQGTWIDYKRNDCMLEELKNNVYTAGQNLKYETNRVQHVYKVQREILPKLQTYKAGLHESGQRV